MVFFILISIVLLFQHFGVLHSAADFFKSTHLTCLSLVPASEAQEIVAAFVCGEKIHSVELVDFLSRSSLYHLVIVAKAHLSAGCAILVWISQKAGSRWIAGFLMITIMSAYILGCGPQAPLLRAGFAVGIFLVSRKFRLGWSKIFSLMLATLACLAINPEWVQSLALLHSSACALAFILAEKFGFKKASAFVFSFFATLPFLWGWGNLHPIGIVMNVLAAPILFTLWLSCSLLSVLVPSLADLWSKVVMSSLHVGQAFLETVPSLEHSKHLPSLLLWSLFWLAGMGLWAHRRFLRGT